MLHVCSVRHLDGYRLALTFSDGTEGIADLDGHLDRPFFAPIRDVHAFARAYADEHTVCWPGGVHIAPEYVYALAHELAPPKTLEETNENELEVSLRELRKLAGATR